MTLLAFSILSARGGNDVGGIIFAAFVAFIIVIASVVSAASKRKAEAAARQRQAHHENWARIEQEMRERAARAMGALGQVPGQGYPQSAPPPPLPPMYGQVPSPVPHQHVPRSAPPPTPVFAPTRSIEGPYVPPRPPTQKTPVARQVQPRQAPPVPRARAVAQPSRTRKFNQPAGRVPTVPTAPPVPPAVPVAARAPVAPPARRDAQASSGVTSAALSRWLSAKTLRSQFILTEIFQPPLALREPPGPPGGL